MILLTMIVMKTKTHMLDILEVEKLDRSEGGQTEQPEREDIIKEGRRGHYRKYDNDDDDGKHQEMMISPLDIC